MAGVNKVIELYQTGKSIPDVSASLGIPKSTVRLRLLKAGVLRSRADGVRLAREKLGSGHRGKSRVFTGEHKRAISAARLAHGEMYAAGVSVKSSGYVEYTRGPHKGRTVHVVKMEERIGRRLHRDEVVHHIDHNRSNNHDDNLALMTRAAHARLHRREDRMSGKAN